MLPTDVDMEGPCSSTLKEIQEQLNELNRLAEEELDKGRGRNQALVAQYERRAERLIAQMKLLPPGEVQMRSVLSSIACLRLHILTSMHTQVIVTRASCQPQATVVRVWLFAVFCDCKYLQSPGCMSCEKSPRSRPILASRTPAYTTRTCNQFVQA